MKYTHMNGVTAIILGGGRGTRLFPLTLDRAKPAVSFAGKYRLIDIPLSNSINSGIKRMFVLTQFKSAGLHRHIMQTYKFDNFSEGFVDILAPEQTLQKSDWFQGTADAVRATLNYTTYYKSEQMLILSGDHLYRMDYTDLIRFHRETKAEITLCVYPINYAEAPEMGLLKVDNYSQVKEFVEKPKDPIIIQNFKAPLDLFASQGFAIDSDKYLASMGIYVFEPHVLNSLLKDTTKNDFGHDIIPTAIKYYRTMAYPFFGYWKDIGTISSYFDANISLAQSEPPFYLYWPRWPFFTCNRSLPPTRIVRSEIRDSLLVEGSDINGAHIADSIIGVRSIIREGSCLNDVVLLGADFYDGEQNLNNQGNADAPTMGIGRNCIIERAIIDKNVHIGDGVIISAKKNSKDIQKDNHWVREGITIIPEGAVIPPGTEI